MNLFFILTVVLGVVPVLSSFGEREILPILLSRIGTDILTPWSRVLLEKLTSKLCS